MESGLTIKADNMAEVVRAVQELTKRKVLVGIPAETADDHGNRDKIDEPISNAAIGYLNEGGIPEKNVPARPHLVPGVEATMPDAVKRFKKAAQEALTGNLKEIDVQMNAVALMDMW